MVVEKAAFLFVRNDGPEFPACVVAGGSVQDRSCRIGGTGGPSSKLSAAILLTPLLAKDKFKQIVHVLGYQPDS